MPQIKSAKKRVITQESARQRNAAQRSALRTTIKKFKTAKATGADDSQELFQAATRAIDMAKSKGLIHANKAARDKSRLAAINNK
ncbi:30S ribosomal protein S20 [Lacticaseibacillus pantheris]|jgi:small subunit ribosomal protein S20|uniref:Small ribosomal subunit protein bS20 n=1 Tax=Lacticaseibacillus pantheris DSM 15945 = JCM 12539 = NBRC 106106 TaxID=1423783 RepID=A0A0R1TXR9_9LACO|nr:30S ribosomal protein S20 [Lacticaseibacillus pantheris]KRL85550.1 hypothetical protein FC50_GL001719 [Lacticaseibacillus pantheris DSM 15945 = JCM 12539 = NBRC 106106]WKF85379.1 30S ribosomal protein S20 [Lacticaseibacillus pantheris]